MGLLASYSQLTQRGSTGSQRSRQWLSRPSEVCGLQILLSCRTLRLETDFYGFALRPVEFAALPQGRRPQWWDGIRVFFRQHRLTLILFCRPKFGFAKCMQCKGFADYLVEKDRHLVLYWNPYLWFYPVHVLTITTYVQIIHSFILKMVPRSLIRRT